jgi:DNA-methyltransferase
MTSNHITSAKRLLVSPLRYPGGKGMLYSRLLQIIRENNLNSSTYIEPYAGGAGAALSLLISGHVENIVINDLDPAIYSFWRSVTEDSKEFSDLIRNATLSIDEWEKQRYIYDNPSKHDYIQLGYATFYLNRTNRSGIITGGPIGGKYQLGNYKIDARFNRESLLERIRLIGLYSKRITVTNMNGVEVICKYSTGENSFIYADPPYFEKAGSLYLNSFKKYDHEELANCLNSLKNSLWLLTYDNVPDVYKLYSNRKKILYSLNYSAHRVVKASEIMVFSDELNIPHSMQCDSNKLWEKFHS